MTGKKTIEREVRRILTDNRSIPNARTWKTRLNKDKLSFEKQFEIIEEYGDKIVNLSLSYKCN